MATDFDVVWLKFFGVKGDGGCHLGGSAPERFAAIFDPALRGVRDGIGGVIFFMFRGEADELDLMAEGPL